MSSTSASEHSAPTETTPPEPAHLTIDAHVVVQLGAELITDPEQALLELIKNSYDADGAWCNVIIDTSYEEIDPVSKAVLRGKISIEDNGQGMLPDQIRKGWLSISLSLKREAKRTGIRTPKFQRFPMGDKGLGRVSSMRLGDLLRVSTRTSETEPGQKVWFKWSDCKSGVPLDKVPVGEESIQASGGTGTTVEIIGLRDLAHWKHTEARERLQAKMSGMVSPFKQFVDFLPSVTVDGEPIDLVDLTSQALDVAISQFSCKWAEHIDTSSKTDGLDKLRGEIELIGKVKIDLFKGKDTESFEKFVAPDKGEKLITFIKEEKFASSYDSLEKGDDGWHLKFKVTVKDVDIPWGDTQKKGRRAQKNTTPVQDSLFASGANFPGPFTSELYAYSYDDQVFQALLTGNNVSKNFIQELSGVAIFRDGFRVRTGNDWLRLADSFTSGTSFYGLRPKNVLGYVALSSEGNAQLQETSNRENFVDNNEWKTFYKLMLYFRDFSNQALENLRRAYPKFLATQGPVIAPELRSSKQALDHIVEVDKIASEKDQQREIARRAAVVTLETTTKRLLEVRNSSIDQTTVALAVELQDQIESVRSHLDTERNEPSPDVVARAGLGVAAEIISDNLVQVERQIEEVYEHVAIGLAAQGVVHDVDGLIEEILSRLARIEKATLEAPLKNHAVLRDVSATKTLVRLIGKQLGTLNPMLRQYREKREPISLTGFLTEFFSLRETRYKEMGLEVFLPESQADIILKINRGRLTQVFDNLARNSEYWLMDTLGRDFKIAPQIHLSLSNSTIAFWDSGRGIRPAMEEVLFNLFISDKPREQGQGLGLFIVQELLKVENCQISLGPERNSYGRRFKFYIDFSGVVDGRK